MIQPTRLIHLLLIAIFAACQTVPPPVIDRAKTSTGDPTRKLQQRVVAEVVSGEDVVTAYLFAEELLIHNRIEESEIFLRAVFREQPSAVVGLKLAAVLMLRNRLDESEQLLRRLVLYYPKDPNTLLSLAQLLRKRMRTAEAHQLLADAHKRDPKDEEIAEAYLEMLLEGGQTNRGNILLENLVLSFPNSHVFLARLASLRVQQERYDDAEKLLSKLLQIAPEHIEGRILAGYLAQRREKHALAEKHFAWANSLMPGDDRVVGFYVQSLLAQEKFEEARRVLSRLEDSLEPSETLSPELSLQFGNTLYFLNHFAEARERFLQNPEELDDPGTGFYLAGLSSERLQDYSSAIENYRKVPPDSRFARRAHQRLIQGHIFLGDYEDARKFLEKFSFTNNDDEEIFLFVIDAWGRLQEYNRALEAAAEGLRRFPKSTSLAFAKIPWIEVAKSRAEAIRALERFLQKHPNYVTALNYLGYTLAEMGQRLDEAIELLEKANRIEPEHGFYMDSLGWAYLRKGNLDKAQQLLERAHVLEPDEPIILEHLGVLFLARGRPDRALEHYRAADLLYQKAARGRLETDREWSESSVRVKAALERIRSEALPFKGEE